MSAFNLVSTGIPQLDENIGGGIPKGSLIIIEDHVGSEADPIGLQFIVSGLQQGEYGYILATENTFSYYEEILEGLGINPKTYFETNRLKFIDGFTTYSQKDIYRTGEDIINDLSQPRQINETIRRSLLHVKSDDIVVRGFIDSLSSIIWAANDVKSVFSFLHQRLAATRTNKHITFLILHADAHNERLVRGIEHLADGIIKIEPTVEEDGTILNEISIINMRGVPYLNQTKIKYKYISGTLIFI